MGRAQEVGDVVHRRGGERVIALGSTLRNVPSGVSNVDTPSVVTSRYGVSSGAERQQLGVLRTQDAVSAMAHGRPPAGGTGARSVTPAGSVPVSRGGRYLRSRHGAARGGRHPGRSAGRHVRHHVEELTGAESTITSLVRSLRWIGPDADVFKGKWDSGMRTQLTTVADRLATVAKDLRSQAEAQRTASEGDLPAIPPGAGSGIVDERRQELADCAGAGRGGARLAAADAWAEDAGRTQIRDMADAPTPSSWPGGRASPTTSAPPSCATTRVPCSDSTASPPTCATRPGRTTSTPSAATSRSVRPRTS